MAIEWARHGIQVNAIMCSKVFRRDFWLDNDLAFVEGIIYEDQQVSAEAYTRAKAFDVLTQPIYNWRARMDRTSISQNKKEARNLRAQFAARGHGHLVERVARRGQTRRLPDRRPQGPDRLCVAAGGGERARRSGAASR